MSTKACLALLNEPINWLLTPHGDGFALGWKGPSEYREKAYVLFVNYHEPTKRKGRFSVSRPAPLLVTLSDDTSYIYLPNLETITKTLHLYFHVQAARDGDIQVTKGWKGEDTDESPLEYVFDYSVEQADKLAAQSVEVFMSAIKHINFIPSVIKPQGEVYSVGRRFREESHVVEDYATAASA